MVLGKIYRVYKKLDRESQSCSLLVTNRNEKGESLLFEGNAVANLNAQETEAIKPLYETHCDIYGNLGCLQINLSETYILTYFVGISGCVSVGKLAHSEIFKITDAEFVSLRNPGGDLDRIQELARLFKSGAFYFASSTNPSKQPLDLSIAFQRQSRTKETDNRFFWNRTLYLYFIRYGINTDKWLSKIIAGSVVISTIYAAQHQVRACIISRLNQERVGTRFNVRGVNDDGQVANFVETEQCIFLDDQSAKYSSYMMLRGSVPLFWTQFGINVGSHKIRLSRGSELTQPAYDKHLISLKKYYGKQCIVNLLGSKEGEAMLSRMYREHHQVSCYSKDVPFVSFDYHTQCPRGKQDNLKKKLLYDINKQLNEYGFYVSSKFGTNDQMSNEELERLNESYQIGTFRVNCVDCLDRTNSVQTFIGLIVLLKQLNALGIELKPQVIERIEEGYRNIWIKNGDQLSRIYAGTGALEGKSKLKDSTLSVARTIQNNLFDTSKQEAFDLLLTPKYVTNQYYEKAKSFLPKHYLCLPRNILTNLCDRYLDYTDPLNIRLTIGTWNINGGKHFSNKQYKQTDPLSDWLLDYENPRKNQTKPEPLNIMDLSLNDMQSPGGSEDSDTLSSRSYNSDIFVIGLEEIVDLNASNIVSASTTNQREFLMEFQQTISRDVPYVLVTSTQLVGVCLYVFVRPMMASYIRDVQIDQVKTGLSGVAGNKGGVAIRMTFYNSSLCFVCSHFAAGQSHVEERNSDFHEITRKISFGSGRTLTCHDYIFWAGDFNYRIDIGNEEARQLIEEDKLDILLENDQLKKSQAAGKVFSKYLEGEIKFGPTYKFDVHTDVYDTSEKQRIPAYTDRILYCKMYPTNRNETGEQLDYGQIEFYGRAELRTSDHRPVVARINCEVLKVNRLKMEEIYEQVVREAGPQDSSVIIKHEDGHAGFNNELLAEILQILVQIGGKVALTRFQAESLVVIFKDPNDALKAIENSNVLTNFNDKLSMQLKTQNWLEKIEEEFRLVQSNTVPLCTGEEINIDNEIDYFSTSIGPACDPSTFCLDDDDIDRNPSPNDEFIQQPVTLSKQPLKSVPPPRPNAPLQKLPEPLQVNHVNRSSSSPAQKLPCRPAPPVPISKDLKAQLNQQNKPKLDLLPNEATNELNSSTASSYTSESEFESSLEPPSLPAPLLPSASSEDDLDEQTENPPQPPNRIDSHFKPSTVPPIIPPRKRN